MSRVSTFIFKLFSRKLRIDEVIINGNVGKIQENSNRKLIISVDKGRYTKFYNYNKKTGEKAIRNIYHG